MGRPSIEDRLAIEDLMVRYTTALDEGDIEGVVACFAEDGWLDSPIVGRHQGHAELRQFAELTAKPTRAGVRFRHVVSNFRIDVEGNRGRVRCYLLDWATVGRETTLLAPGEYDCELVRGPDGWLLQNRQVRMDHPFEIPTGNMRS